MAPPPAPVRRSIVQRPDAALAVLSAVAVVFLSAVATGGLLGVGLVVEALLPALDTPQFESTPAHDHIFAPLGATLTTLRIAMLARSVNPDLDAETAWRIAAAVRREAARHGLDPVLVAAVIRIESRFDPAAVGGAGEIGLMQILPSTLPFAARAAGLPLPTAEEAFLPETNVILGTAYLAENLRLVRRSAPDADATALALISYNRGLDRALAEHRADRLVTEYGRRVLETYEAWRISSRPPADD